MNLSSSVKMIIAAIAVVALSVVAFLVHGLAGLGAEQVVFAKPPTLIENYASKLSDANPVGFPDSLTPFKMELSEAEKGQVTKDIALEKALVHQVFFEGESPDLLLQMFGHPDKTQRIKIAAAFSDVNIEFTHDEESGFAQQRDLFWAQSEAHHENIRNALFEALVAAAEEGATSYIPYTIAWMPGQGPETVEVLVWASKHHPHWWVRRFSVYFVSEFGQNDELASLVLSNQTHDPDYRVRKQVFDLRLNKIFGS